MGTVPLAQHDQRVPAKGPQKGEQGKERSIVTMQKAKSPTHSLSVLQDLLPAARFARMAPLDQEVVKEDPKGQEPEFLMRDRREMTFEEPDITKAKRLLVTRADRVSLEGIWNGKTIIIGSLLRDASPSCGLYSRLNKINAPDAIENLTNDRS